MAIVEGCDLFLAEKNQRLIKLRKARDLTQLDVAEALRLKQNTISCYENGTRTPKLKTMKKLALFYGVSPEFLFFDELNVGIHNNQIGKEDDCYESIDQ